LSLEQALAAARAAGEKTLDETVVLDVGEHLAITDYFVITSGRNDRQVRSIVDEIDRRLRMSGGGPPRQVEGLDAAEWVLVDYGDFVVHVFSPEARDLYALERLWADSTRILTVGDLASSRARS